MRLLALVVVLVAGVLAPVGSLAAQVPDPDSRGEVRPFAPGVRYDPQIPTLAQVTGHAFGESISNHADVEKYVYALAEASPRVRWFAMGQSWQGRSLYYVAVANEDRIDRLDEIQAAMKRLADPRGLDDASAERLIEATPAVGWLANCVHGDEPSGTDAALLVLYHLVAAENDPVVDTILRECVVLVDPLQNPDGRDRFVHSTRDARGRWPDATPASAEHSQPWPGGRVNHALFDMNRDWFALSQPETRSRVAAFLAWWPLVYVDLHEMGGNSTYYFAPPAKPVNEEITESQRGWLDRYGRNNARWFDRYGFDYFTREAYDAFYPGYGEGWPMFQGSIGMTFEMASARGIVYRRQNETLLFYRDGVQRHFVASMGTLETLANGRKDALRAFLAHRRAGVARGRTGDVREYVFPATGDRTRTARLMNLLIAQGIEVHRATTELRTTAARPLGADPEAVPAAGRTFPAGSFVLSMSQPSSTLARVLVHPHFTLDSDWLEEQKTRAARRQRTEFYDLTAWSMPLLFGVETWQTSAAVSGERELLHHGMANAGALPLRVDVPKVAYVMPWGTNGAAAMLAELLRHGVRARCIDRAFTLGDIDFPAGSIVIKVNDLSGAERTRLHGRMRDLATAHGVSVHCADSSWVDEGPNFGTNRALDLKTPRVAMLWDEPVSRYSAGWARYLLEQRYGVPVSPVRVRDLGRVDLDRFTVLIAPAGRGYSGELGKRGVDAIQGFVRRGGVLITFSSATRWLTQKDVGLLATEAESRQHPDADGDDEAKENDDEKAEPAKDEAGEKAVAAAGPGAPAKKPKKEFDYDRAIRPDEESPQSVPGAILTVAVDGEHWLGFGYPSGRAAVIHDSSNIFTPVKLDRGTNVATYAPADELVQAGFVWEDTRRQLPQKAFLVHQPHGRGHVVAFAEDPNVRAFADGLNLMLMNAVLLTAGR